MAGPKRIRRGEVLPGIPSESWNAFCEATERVQALTLAGAGTGQSAGAQRITAQVQNTTGVLIDADFPVLEIDGPVYNATDRAGVVFEGITLKGKTPTATARMADLVIVQGAIKGSGSDAFRQAVVIGPTWCNVDVTDAAHTHVIPKVGDNTRLSSAGSGTIKMFWKETGVGLKKALIILGGGGEGGGKLRIGLTRAAGISARSSLTLGSGIVDWYTSVNRPTIAATGQSDTVYNVASTAVGGNKFIIAAQDEQQTWLVIVEDCT